MKRRGYRDRRVATRTPRPTILIVCEGERTEPNYFKSFRVTPNVIDVRGIGANTLSLVRRTIVIRDDDGPFDQTWCVFDRDSFPAADFNEAIRLAAASDIHVAYTNEAFELWYLLHFNFHTAAYHRSRYSSMLSQRSRLGHPYEKNSTDMYNELLDRQETAIGHAETLLNRYDPSRPERDNPSTTVHLLVQELNKWVKP